MSNLKRLEISTPSDFEIVITRSFAATRTLVWEAMTKTEFIKQWLHGPPGWSMSICEDDLRVGGEFRWGWQGPDGNEMLMHGVYREVVAPERIVRTEVFAFGCGDGSGAEQLCTIIFFEDGDQTKMTLTVLYPSKEARDGALASGMEQGMAAGYDRLDQFLAAGVVA